MRVQIVSFHCVLKNNLGHLISSSFNQDVITTQIEPAAPMLPKFVEVLQSLKKGEKREISLSADEAYGFYDPRLTMQVPRSQLKRGKHLRMGDQVEGMSLHDERPRMFRVIACSEKAVQLDANHPLAGQDLVFNVEVTSTHEENEPAAPVERGSMLC